LPTVSQPFSASPLLRTFTIRLYLRRRQLSPGLPLYPCLPAQPRHLSRRKPSSLPPQPLKFHQTGSRNPFGLPRAPSPPAPTSFKIANGMPQSQPQSQSPCR
jgi:hypothetical protein